MWPPEQPEAFIAALRDLKERSGLTYRQLEERAAEVGDALRRSTVSDVLNGTRMPSTDFVALFIRTCGDGVRVEEWVAYHQKASRQQKRQPSKQRRNVLMLAALSALVGAVLRVSRNLGRVRSSSRSRAVAVSAS
ncbi:helix-turn-helix domain-containing protein [Streptomyces sp. NPDC059850]|uniref:helix-turn-helix domain-containing protein n=1 Tax=Streptomyces sp. NPDC059850 TaxID=3346970 RepID=UPI003646E6EF